MKKRTYHFTFLIAITVTAAALILSVTTWGQVKVDAPKTGTPQTPIKIGEKNTAGSRPEMRIEDKVESLMKRVDALEAENKELKQQVFAAKLLLTGLDKQFASHTHRLRASAIGLALKCDTSVGNCAVKPMNPGGYLYIPSGTANPGEYMMTTPPAK